ncbi:lipopolysaccharide biosynthesis protein [Enterococcus casseliflavus]|uniref:lipopolysaccharide biosynthesis protein n=1 Tax=Enterococcus casseliflavus TaxID=37734 RepID=UPI0035CA81FF
MNKYKKLFQNSLVFAIGNLGSKIVSIIMVPLYTHYLSTEQYGQVDLIITAISLLLPIISLAIGQAVIRFAVSHSNKESERQIFSNAVCINILALLLLLLIYPALNYFKVFDNYLELFLILLISQMFGETLSQFTRGIGKVKQYAFNGILTTFIVACLNIFLLVTLDMGIVGYLLSMIFSSVVSNIYLFLVVKGFTLFSIKKIDKKLTRNMLVYSVPLIPNSIMWWVINGSTRYFILIFAGMSANGLFAVANKLPSILSIVTNIFSQAWQLSAFEEQDSADKSSFYTLVFKNYYIVLFLFASLIMVINKPLITYTVGSDFVDSWKIVPFLLLASIYQSFSGFLGTSYTASLQTKGVFITSIYGSIVSVIANVLLIPLFGVYGAGVGSCIAFVTMYLFRLRDTKNIIGLNVDTKLFLFLNILFLLQLVIMHMFSGIILIIAETALFSVMLYVVWSHLQPILKKVLNR